MTSIEFPRVSVVKSGGIMGVTECHEISGAQVSLARSVGGPLDVDRAPSSAELSEVLMAVGRATRFSQADISRRGLICDGFHFSVTVTSSTSEPWSVTFGQGDRVPADIKALVSRVFEITRREVGGPGELTL